MKTINGVLIVWSEIKISAGGCELFVVDLEGGGGGGGWGAGNGHPAHITPCHTAGEKGEGRFFFFFFNLQKAVLLM